jgi:hypothetical protein
VESRSRRGEENESRDKEQQPKQRGKTHDLYSG